MFKGIIVGLEVEGFHRWPEAKDVFPEVGFLSDRHRHMFKIQAMKEVKHNDRDVEIILFKRSVENYLRSKYGTPCEFGRMSCEDIAEELFKEFKCEQVVVEEDGENGAIVTK